MCALCIGCFFVFLSFLDSLNITFVWTIWCVCVERSLLSIEFRLGMIVSAECNTQIMYISLLCDCIYCVVLSCCCCCCCCFLVMCVCVLCLCPHYYLVKYASNFIHFFCCFVFKINFM